MTLSDQQPYSVGVPVALQPDLHCVLAPNPSPMTYWGTNTYLLGQDTLAVIDPGPMIQSHLDALIAAIAGRPVTHILLTHSHLDHSPMARPLAERVNAPILAFGDSVAGRSAVMAELAADGLVGGGEGIDHDFQPDQCLKDGQRLADAWGEIRVLHTPGHIGNHVCFQWQDDIFTGDHVMGWASSLVSPPDGDLTDFMASCGRLKGINARRYYPAHGAPITDPSTRLDWLITHRMSRETQIIETLVKTPKTVPDLTREIYTDVTPALLPAAERNVFAHLVDLFGRGIVEATPQLSVNANFRLSARSNASPKGMS